MPSLRSRLLIFALKNRHLLKFRLKPEVIDWNTSTVQLREEYAKAALRAGKMPAGIEVTPVSADGLTAEWITEGAHWVTAGAPIDKVIFYTHGGGYVTGSCQDHRMHVAKFVQGSGVGAFLYDYRLAPEHPYPAAVEDSITAYRWLLGQGVSPERIVIVGESAGGGLCLALLLALRDSGLPLPAAGVALSPWTDLKCTGDSYRTNAQADISTLGSWTVWGKYYAGDNDPALPWISPLYGDLRGLPPIMIQVGDAEILLDDAVRFAQKAEAAGVEVTLRVWPGMVHCFPLLAPLFPEATQAMQETCAYIRAHAG
jgi:monoterpene epsilon-lactone hydrolase